MKIFLLLCVLTVSLFHQHAHAQGATDVDESFDPFSDYNEFEQDADEEADINFFKNGRMLTLGLELGYRGFTQGFSQAYTPAPIYGFQFNYFFDLQTALSVNYVTGDHNVAFHSLTGTGAVNNEYTGTVNIQAFDLSFRYYFNTENVTRGLADLNPYMNIGAAYYIRTYSLSGELDVSPDVVYGAKASVGIEIPLMRRRAFLGVQAAYNYVQFPDENKHFIEEANSTAPNGIAKSPISPDLNGDMFEISTILGINF